MYIRRGSVRLCSSALSWSPGAGTIDHWVTILLIDWSFLRPLNWLQLSNSSFFRSYDAPQLSNPVMLQRKGRQKVDWVFFEESWHDQNSVCTTAKTKRHSNLAPTTGNGWTSRSTTASCTLSILIGQHCVPALLGVTLQSYCKNFQ